MPEHLRALIVILVLATGVFAIARAPALSHVQLADFRRWRNLWLATTLAAFLAHDFWLYTVLAGLLIAYFLTREHNLVAAFFMLLFAVPAIGASIPGFGMVNYLFDLDHLRLLALAILVPGFVRLQTRANRLAFARAAPDRIIVVYAVLVVALQFRDTSPTDALRQGFYVLVGMLLPYYVISRSLRDLQAFREAMTAFVLAAAVVAAIGLFEFARHWLLYKAMVGALGLDWNFLGYLGRTGSLRAAASTGHPISLGYVMVVAIGFFLFLKERSPSVLHRRLGLAGLAGGLLSSLSRGPWVGSAVLAIVFLGTGRFAFRRIAVAGFGGVLALALLAVLPGGERIINLLPWIGTVDSENIAYREQLMQNAWIVIQRNPWFGSVAYLQAPEMEAMRQGQGIIDIVNTYIGVALESGLVGLALFTGFFASVLLGTWGSLRRLRDADAEEYLLGRSLLATLSAVLIIIVTVSSITVIPIVYWSIAAMCVAYAQMVREKISGKANRSAAGNVGLVT